MKFQLLSAIVLCICVGQLCSSSEIEYRIKSIKNTLQNDIHGVGKQFVEDITTILDHTPSNICFIDILDGGLFYTLGQITIRENNTKFSVSNIRYFRRLTAGLLTLDYHTSLQKLDKYEILQSTLSKQFPAERYNGIMNMFYINYYPNATAEEIANTLNYLDGTDNAAREVSYLDLHNIPDPVASDCPEVTRYYTEAVDQLKSMIGIKPNVFEDFASIQEKFPCTPPATDCPRLLVQMLKELHGDKSKIDACTILKGNLGMNVTDDEFEYYTVVRKSVLSVRLPEETFRGVFNVLRAYEVSTPKDEVEKALEYLYDDVPEADC